MIPSGLGNGAMIGSISVTEFAIIVVVVLVSLILIGVAIFFYKRWVVLVARLTRRRQRWNSLRRTMPRPAVPPPYEPPPSDTQRLEMTPNRYAAPPPYPGESSASRTLYGAWAPKRKR